MPSFAEFLLRNSVEKSDRLPFVHTTQAFKLRSIMEKGVIEAQACDVFRDEKLNYLFVGRPAYKYQMDCSSDEFWLFPTVFIFDIPDIRAKRIFPFDSGGFSKGSMPGFIDCMDLGFFDAASVSDAPERIMGAFFGNALNYINFHGLSTERFSEKIELSPLDAEMHALHKLAMDSKKPAFDDRQFTIEVQTEDSIDLKGKNLLAVVLPANYLDDERVTEFFQKKGVQLLSYDLAPIEPKMHFYAVYDRVKTFYQERNLI